MQQTITKYIEQCLAFVQENKEYLMWVPFYEEPIPAEMQDSIDATALQSKLGSKWLKIGSRRLTGVLLQYSIKAIKLT